MKRVHLIFASLILAYSCAKEEADLKSNLTERVNFETWREIGVRNASTGEIAPVDSSVAFKLRILGDDVVFVTDSSSCVGKISEFNLTFDFNCAYTSPSWNIVERTENKMFIYPRLGAMYYFDYVLEKQPGSSCSIPIRCGLSPNAGQCEALILKYYFDKAEGKCKQFIWGGCDGVVPFDTMEECKQCECNKSNGK